MESINYTFNPEYKKFVCYIVGQRIHKDERNVTEYEVIDYIQSLNTHQTEGAQTAQEKEGAYSEYRVFVEELRTHLQRNGKTGQSVEVTSTKADNSFEIKGLPYGYYIIDEVTEVKGTNSAASLCMVSTANPEMNLNIKSDYPVVTKRSGKMMIRTKLEIRDGMIWLILKSGRLFRIGMSQICLMLTDTTPIITHGMM